MTKAKKKKKGGFDKVAYRKQWAKDNPDKIAKYAKNYLAKKTGKKSKKKKK